MPSALRPLYGTHLAVVAAQADPRSKQAVCARWGINFTRTVRADRTPHTTCRDCKQVAPRFAQGETRDHNPHHRTPTTHHETAPQATADR